MDAAFLERENKQIAQAYKELLRDSYRVMGDEDKDLIRRAFEVAVDAHKDQRRKSGEAYIFHPIAVAKIVAQEIGMDATAIAAALMHDVVEDSDDYTLDDIERLFNPTIARIVNGLTKISSLPKNKDVSQQAENFRKLLLTLNEDLRVIVIKIADRLHNMITMDAMRPDKQVKIASETLFIYAPLAHRMGFYNIKTQLEDLGLKYTQPEVFNSITAAIQESKEEQERYLQDFKAILEDSLKAIGVTCEIAGRHKSVYSIHRKMVAQGVEFDEVYDKYAIRIIYKPVGTDEKIDAWRIYSIVTDHFKPQPNRLRDWLSMPKGTGYEALHITVLGPNNRWVEVQIRSERMHEIAEHGMAAHYKYKNDEKEDGLEEWLDRIQGLITENPNNAIELVEDVKLNLYAKEIFVVTPNGDTKRLPKGSTALDFAFSVHTEVGMHTQGTRVNGKLVPLSHELKTGDHVEVITSDKAQPNSAWLNYAKSSRARTKIKSFLRSENKEVAEEGKQILKRKLRGLKLPFSESMVNELVSHFKLQTSQDLFFRVGTGNIDNLSLKDFANKRSSPIVDYFKNKFRRKASPAAPATDDSEITTNYDQVVFGREEQFLPYTLAKCCNPIPGDSVFGFTTVNDGIKVHKHDCKNAVSLQANYAYRIQNAKWIDSTQRDFPVRLQLTGIDRQGLVSEITSQVSKNLNTNMKELTFSSDDGIFRGEITVIVPNRSMLNRVIKQLKSIEGIERIERSDR